LIKVKCVLLLRWVDEDGICVMPRGSQAL
jgi:hypothetical protein